MVRAGNEEEEEGPEGEDGLGEAWGDALGWCGWVGGLREEVEVGGWMDE